MRDSDKTVAWAVVVACTAILMTAASANAQGEPEKSLAECQKTAGKGVAKYAAAYQKTVTSCLDKIAKERIKEAEGDAAGAAQACRAKLGKIIDSDDPDKTVAAKAADKIDKKCDPAHENFGGAHTVADVLGTGATVVGDAVNADELGAWCAAFGGDGSVDSIQEWIDCMLAAATCHARQQIASSYPNSLDWLADVRGDIEALGASDPKVIDALAALDDLDAALDDDSNGAFDLVCGPNDPPIIGQLPATGKVTSHGAGDDGDVQAGVARSFTDNGDGTITDHATQLTWEKKEDLNASFVSCLTEVSAPSCANPHDADNRYNWCGDVDSSGACDTVGNPYDGTVTTVFLAQLNHRCNSDVSVDCTTGGDADCSGVGGVCGFAGHRDWRLPNRLELESLLDLGDTTSPITFGPFDTGCSSSCTLTDVDTCSCTAVASQWSSSAVTFTSTNAWNISFSLGTAAIGTRSLELHTRAVRGGL